MPDPLQDDTLEKSSITEATKDTDMIQERHSIAMSYLVTVVHFFEVGEARIDLLDSRFGRTEFAKIQKAIDTDSREVSSRLVVAEDLPRATYDLLENTIGVDPYLLDDHRHNGHGPDLISRADLDVDKASRLHSSSVALPFELQIGPEMFPWVIGRDSSSVVENDVAAILRYHQLVNYLRYDWQNLSVTKPLPALIFTTYRRLSYQTISTKPPTAVLLLYPPLWNLQDFQGSKYQFHTSPDLRFIPSQSHDTSKSFDKTVHDFPALLDLPVRTQQILKRISGDVGFTSLDMNDLIIWISEWILDNAYTSFEASAESSVRSWKYLRSHNKATEGEFTPKMHLCQQLRQRVLTKIRQMDKVYTELHIGGNPESGLYASRESRHQDYVVQQWQRARQSLQWVLDDVDHAFRSIQGDLNVDLAESQFEESGRAIQEAQVVRRLTALAFIFIPISTVCSAFGMNVSELSGELPPVWIFVVVALAITSFTVICSLELTRNIFYAFLDIIYTAITAWKAWWQWIYDTSSLERDAFGRGVVSIGANLASVHLHLAGQILRRNWDWQTVIVRTTACMMLIPFWIMDSTVRRFRKLERRGRNFHYRQAP